MARGTVEILSPIAGTRTGGMRLTSGVADLQGRTVGLLDNSMPHAGDFLGSSRWTT